MQNFMKTIINAVQVWTSKKIKDSTADWNQNDPNADNYVKNRTHWEEEAVIVTERVISGFSLMEESLYAVENPFRMSPVVGSTYTVVWDGVSYDVKMQSFDGLGYIGNVNYVNMASGGNIPFAIVFAEDVFLVTESPAASHTISISGAVVHKLDSKYLDLPTNLATTDDVQEAVDVANEAHNIANSKMKANNPVGTGSFSMNRKSGTTIGDFSHAEGRNTTASGSNSHAEGYYTTAFGSNSHAEGYYTTASGRSSHAEGYYTTASGFYSHAEGSGTRAIGDSSHAEGRYNILDTTDTYVHIVGNGESDTARSNAHTLDWDGNAWYQGDVYVGSTSGTNKDEGSKKLATEEYVDTALEDLSASGGFVVQAEPPEDKSVLWVDTDDESEDSGGNVDLTGYATEEWVQAGFQPKGDYLTEVPEGYATKNDIPTKVSELDNDKGYLTERQDLTGYATERYVQGYAQPKGEYLTAVPDGYAKTEDIPTKPEDIGAQPAGNYALKSEIPSVPVQSVNGKTGAVKLGAGDVGARPSNWMPTAQEVGALPDTYVPPNQTAAQVGADPAGTAAAVVSAHNTNTDAHNDIRLKLKAINDRLNAFFDSDNQTLDELSEIVAYITNNKTLIDSITTSKVNVADIINNLTTNVANKPLSAAQGVVLKNLIDAVSNSLSNYQPKGDYALRSELPNVPTKLSAFTNDSGFITGYTETDPTVPAWAKQSTKPSYSKSEVGLGNVDNVKQYSANNPPPYPVTSVNGKTGDVTLDFVPDAVVAEASRVVDTALTREDSRIFRFLAVADAHQKNEDYYSAEITAGTKELGQAVGEVLRQIGVDFVANLGDTTWGASESSSATVLEEAKAFNKLFTDSIRGETQLWVEGNHETEKLTNSQIHSLIYSHNKGLTQDADHWIEGYGYMDFPNKKVRVISLNTNQGASGNVVDVSDTQLKWFAETALDMSDKADWSVLTIGHHPIGFNNVALFKNCATVLEAFIGGGNPNFTTNGGTKIDVDYSGKNCQYIGHFHGHVHSYTMTKIRKYVSTGVQQELDAWDICIPNACATRTDQYIQNAEGDYLRTHYSVGGIDYNRPTADGKRTAFTVVTVCMDEKKIYADDYGITPPNIRNVSYDFIPAQTYVNQLPISTDTDGSIYNGIGYKTDTYLSGGNPGNKIGVETTGFIPFDGSGKYEIYMSGVSAKQTDGNFRIMLYDAGKNYHTQFATSNFTNNSYAPLVFTTDADGNITKVDMTDAVAKIEKTTAFFRMCAPEINGSSIITVNQPIT